MAIYIGDSPLVKRYVGSQEVQRVYQGADLVWESGPSWPQTGTWSGNTPTTATALDTFTVPEAGVYDLAWEITWGGTGSVYGQASYRINSGSYANGNPVTNAPGTSTVNGTSVTLQAGDVVEFAGASAAGSRAATGEWSANKVG